MSHLRDETTRGRMGATLSQSNFQTDLALVATGPTAFEVTLPALQGEFELTTLTELNTCVTKTPCITEYARVHAPEISALASEPSSQWQVIEALPNGDGSQMVRRSTASTPQAAVAELILRAQMLGITTVLVTPSSGAAPTLGFESPAGVQCWVVPCANAQPPGNDVTSAPANLAL